MENMRQEMEKKKVENKDGDKSNLTAEFMNAEDDPENDEMA
jgi:hypothetical protein